MPPSSHELYRFQESETHFLQVRDTVFPPIEIVEDEKVITEFSAIKCMPPDLLSRRKPEALFYFPRVMLRVNDFKSHWSIVSYLCEYAIKPGGEGARTDLTRHYQTTLDIAAGGRISAIRINVEEGKIVKLLSGEANGELRQLVYLNGALHALLALSSKAQQQVFNLVEEKGDVYLAYGTPGDKKYSLFFNLQISKTQKEGEYQLKPLKRGDIVSPEVPYFAVFSGIKLKFTDFAAAPVDFANLVE